MAESGERAASSASSASSSDDERRAGWLELFFDLVVVAAVAQLAHRLRAHPDLLDVALCVALYYAVWSVWTGFMLYANVAAEKAGRRAMLEGMFGIALMAAAIPEADHDRGVWFVGAYLACRFIASGVLRKTGKVVTSWPAAQAGAGITPWIISLWADPPVRYWLWALGIVLDLGFAIAGGLRPERVMRNVEDRAERQRARELEMRSRGPAGDGRRGRGPLDMTGVTVHSDHLGERLGLFVIIVLGEAVVQVVTSAAETTWDRPLLITAVAGFGLLVCLWWLILEHGMGAVPDLGHMPVWLAMPSHFVMTAGITATAAGLGAVAEHSDKELPTGVRWVLCGGLALYLLVSVVAGLLLKSDRWWLLACAVPALAIPVAAGLLGGPLPGDVLVVILLAAVGWRVGYPALIERLRARRTAAA